LIRRPSGNARDFLESKDSLNAYQNIKDEYEVPNPSLELEKDLLMFTRKSSHSMSKDTFEHKLEGRPNL
jgi:hypothetical protein